MAHHPTLRGPLTGFQTTSVETNSDLATLISSGGGEMKKGVVGIVCRTGQVTLQYGTTHAIAFIDQGSNLGNVNTLYFPFVVPMRSAAGALLLTTADTPDVTILYY